MIALLATVAAAKPAPVEVPAYVTSARARVDWAIAGQEAVKLLGDYLRVDTTNPPGNEDRAIDFLGAFLDHEGIPYERIPVVGADGQPIPGRSSLVARVKGLGKAPPLCLMSHVDVVPAEPASWPADTGPLSGAVKDGYLWGRGAVDMKGMGAIEVLTLAWLKRTQLPLDRDVVLLAVADEEVSDLGALSLTDPERWKSIGCAEMINEGGLGAKDALFEGQAVHAISTAEKGVLWVRMTAEGRPGHGSTPRGDEEAPVRLLEAMDAMGSDGGKFVLVPQMRELLADIGRNKGGFTGLVLRTPPLRRLLAWGALKKNPTTRAAMHDTIHLTGMEGANEPNVVPGKVSALYDCRLLPGTTPEAMLAELQDRVKKVPGISFEVLHQGLSNESPTDDPLYRAIARYAVEDRPYAVAGPLLSVGYTDSLLLRPLGVNAYGYLPFELPPDVADTMHSNDERIPVDQVGEGLRRLFSIVVEVAGSP